MHKTNDGSHTLYSKQYDAHYHSIHGAVNESNHVFIEAGLVHSGRTPCRILEMGFGTGLNAVLTLEHIKQSGQSIEYTTVERHPISAEYSMELLANGFLPKDMHSFFGFLHHSDWENEQVYDESFSLIKRLGSLEELELEGQYDVVYYDAFAPGTQPELWTEDIFKRIQGWMSVGGVLTTYCCKGQVKRTMKAVGFEVERLEGPPGKRHMLRATKR